MIQQKQTLFLSIIAIIAFLQGFFPFISLTILEYGTFSLSFFPGCGPAIFNSNIVIPSMVNIACLLLNIAIIFLYKNKTLQYKLTILLGLLNVCLFCSFFLLSYINEEIKGVITYKIGTFLPLISSILSFLTANFIKKDEQLVRSADRIR